MTLKLKERLKNTPVHLVPDAKNWSKWWSMRLMILTAIFQTAAITYTSLPFDFTEHFPSWVKAVLGWGALMTAIGAGVARVIQQPGQPVQTITDVDSQYRNY